MSYDYKAQKKYNEKTKTYRVKYYPTDIYESNLLDEYLKNTNQLPGKYIKSLIHKDLQEKGLIGEEHDG